MRGTLFVAFLIGLIVGMAEAGFRCSLGNWACSASCTVAGQSSGTCDDQGNCWCSEQSWDLSDFKNILPTQCDLDESLCASTCHAMGKAGGACTGADGRSCACSGSLTPAQFALCKVESVCRVHCQGRGYATGTCKGWSCECISGSE